jgi:hypothetical protein
LLAAVLVLPVTIGSPGNVGDGLDRPESLAGIRRENRYLASIHTGTLPPVPREVQPGGSVPRNYPPEIAQVRKEVTSAPPPGRLPEPI